jgi:FKBP-type peptidyl-prolyl cis-trans isomerase FkpA
MKHFLLLLLVSITSVHCKKDDQKSQAEIDEAIIQRYIADNGLDAMSIGSGVYYVDEETGTGENPSPSSTVHVAYRGYFTNGSVFDQSSEAGITFGLNQVIQGWQMGIPFFKEGGRGKLLIPSELAYGDRARNGIPANSVLIFDIHLIEVL